MNTDILIKGYQMKYVFRIQSAIFLNLFVFVLTLSCHFQKENPTPIKKDYLYILWVEKTIEDNKKLSQEEILIREKESKTIIEKALSIKKKKQFSEAIQLLESAIDKYINAEVYYEYANVLSSARRFQDAIKAYEISLKLEYKRPELVLYNIACSYSLLNDEENTYKYLEKAIQKGYKAFEYMEKDPDLKNVREKNKVVWDKNIKAFTLPDKEVQSTDVTGLILEGTPRISSYFFICKNGIVIRSDYDAWAYAMYGYTKYGYIKGKWEITNNMLTFVWEKSCKPHSKKPIDFSSFNGNSNSINIQFQGCQRISDISEGGLTKNISNFEKADFKFMVSEHEYDGWLKHKKTKEEPPQCDPEFKPKNLKDLEVVKYFVDYE